MFIAPGYKNIKKNAQKLYINMTSSGTACSPTVSILFFYFLSNWIGGRGRVTEILVYSAMSCTHVCVGHLTPIVTVHLLFALINVVSSVTSSDAVYSYTIMSFEL